MGFTKKIKVPIDGSPTKNQKTMGTLIFLVNSAALHQKHLRIFCMYNFTKFLGRCVTNSKRMMTMSKEDVRAVAGVATLAEYILFIRYFIICN